MKTVMLNFSPKKTQGNSGYFLRLFRRIPFEHISGAGNYNLIYEKIKEADAIVVAFPLYMDAMPSHMLRFLKGLEEYAEHFPFSGKLYAIVNNGFYEGEQCEPALDMLQMFCMRTGIVWGGGLGIGGGEMLGTIKAIPAASGIVTGIMAAYQLATMLMRGTFDFSFWLSHIPWGWFIGGFIVYLMFSGGMLRQIVHMKYAVNRGEVFGNAYTHPTCCPRFFFVLLANMRWIIMAAINGTAFWKMRKRT